MRGRTNLTYYYMHGRGGLVQDKARAVREYRITAKSDDLSAEYNMGICYYNGTGVDKNHVEAVRWFRRAAENGHEDAMYNLDMCYRSGLVGTGDV